MENDTISSSLLKKVFLSFLIGSLSLGVIISIVIFLIGNFNEIELKIISTTFSISAFSFITLMWDKAKENWLKVTGITITTIAFITFLLGIWVNSLDSFVYKTISSYFVLVLSSLIVASFLKEKNQLLSLFGSILTTIYSILITLTIFEVFEQIMILRLITSYIILVAGSAIFASIAKRENKNFLDYTELTTIALSTFALQLPIFIPSIGTLFLRVLLSTIIIMLAIQHWHKLIKSKEKQIVEIIAVIAFIMSIIFTIMLVIFVLTNYQYTGLYIRITGSFGILYLFFTLLGPLVNKFT
jgi:hypothetical protein